MLLSWLREGFAPCNLDRVRGYYGFLNTAKEGRENMSADRDPTARFVVELFSSCEASTSARN